MWNKVFGIIVRLCVSCAALPLCALAQNVAPLVTSIASSASYSTPVAPASLISIFGSGLAVVTQSATPGITPLPTNIAGTSVTVNGYSAPLLYVSNTQINAQMPFAVQDNQDFFRSAAVTVTTPNGSAGLNVPIFDEAPAIFTVDSSGCGQAAALNIAPDGTVSVNSPANSAAPGDYLAIFGTGMGFLAKQPADGTASPVADSFGTIATYLGAAADSIYFGAQQLPSTAVPVSYAGAAPTFVGVDQVNFQVPLNTRNGCAVPIVVNSSISSQAVTVSVNANRGQCVDPPQQSYGQVTLVKTIASGTASDGETDEFDALFPSAPGLAEPGASLLTQDLDNLPVLVPNARACVVPGYSGLNAGTIQIQPAGQTAISAQPVSQTSGVKYQSPLPAGFVGPGPYTIFTSGLFPISFQETMTVGAPIGIQTTLTPGTVLSSQNPPTITWTGGDASSVIRVTLIGDITEVPYSYDVYYVSASAGSLTLPSIAGLVTGRNLGELIFEVLPASAVAASISAPGITQQIQFSWTYRYIFGSLTVDEVTASEK